MSDIQIFEGLYEIDENNISTKNFTICGHNSISCRSNEVLEAGECVCQPNYYKN